MPRGSPVRALAMLAVVLAPLAVLPAAHAAPYSVLGELSIVIGSLSPIPVSASFTVNITTTASGRVDVVTIPESVFSTTAISVLSQPMPVAMTLIYLSVPALLSMSPSSLTLLLSTTVAPSMRAATSVCRVEG